MASNDQTATPEMDTGTKIKLGVFWAFVGIPFAWGVIETLLKASKLV